MCSSEAEKKVFFLCSQERYKASGDRCDAVFASEKVHRRSFYLALAGEIKVSHQQSSSFPRSPTWPPHGAFRPSIASKRDVSFHNYSPFFFSPPSFVCKHCGAFQGLTLGRKASRRAAPRMSQWNISSPRRTGTLLISEKSEKSSAKIIPTQKSSER
jgi:hypothetical protein